MRNLLVIASIILLFSCQREGFDVDSISFRRNVEVVIDQRGIVESYGEELLLKASLSKNGQLYSFQVKSPDEDLIWEGSFDKDGEATLGITDGAMLPSGTYKAIIYSDNGSDKTVDLTLASVDLSFPYITQSGRLSSKKPATVVEFDSNGDEIRKSENVDSSYYIGTSAVEVEIDTLDRYQNNIVVMQKVR